MMEIKSDCRHFKGDRPCVPHKERGVHCDNCSSYIPIDGRILIIKLGQLGDVIRTTPILRKIWSLYPTKEVWWITNYPEAVPKAVDVILPFDSTGILPIMTMHFDWVMNLDKDREACALLNKVLAVNKSGFRLRDGKTYPENEHAEDKYETGVWDDISKQNKKSYQQEIFEICGWTFSGEEYIIDLEANQNLHFSGKHKIVGLNTGCGKRWWLTRLWRTEHWIKLGKELQEMGYIVLLLGGEQEHERNTEIANRGGGQYIGYFPYSKFVSMVNQCDLVVTSVTTAMHIALGLGKKVVALNSIFNPHEFEHYNRLTTILPTKPCECYFEPVCKCDVFCMDTISPQMVMAIIWGALKEKD